MKCSTNSPQYWQDKEILELMTMALDDGHARKKWHLNNVVDSIGDSSKLKF